MKTIKILLTLFAVVSLIGIMSCSKEQGSEQVLDAKILKAKVTLASGNAYILRENQPQKIKVKIGQLILPSDVIITDKGANVNVVIINRGVFKIKENSNVSFKNLLVVDDQNNVARLKVSAGRIVLGLEKLKKNSTFEVETPTAVAGVRGTSFMVSVQQKQTSAFPYFVKVNKKDDVVTKVAVLTGAVELSNPADKSQTLMINSLREATLVNDDFQNVKVEKITRVSVDEISVIKEFSEIKELKLKEISEEMTKIEPQVEESMKSELNTKAEVKSGKENLNNTEAALDKNEIKAKTDALKKVKTSSKKSDGKYLEDEVTW